MSEPAPSGCTDSPVPDRLHQLARCSARHTISDRKCKPLADLIDELGRAVPPGAASTDAQTHLADTTAHLVHALHQRKDAGILNAANLRFEDAALRAEAEAPVATGVVRRVIDALANLGDLNVGDEAIYSGNPTSRRPWQVFVANRLSSGWMPGDDPPCDDGAWCPGAV